MVFSQLSNFGKFVLKVFPDVAARISLRLLFCQQNLVLEELIVLLCTLAALAHHVAADVAVLLLTFTPGENLKHAFALIVVHDIVASHLQVGVDWHRCRRVDVVDRAFRHHVEHLVQIGGLYFFPCLVEISDNHVSLRGHQLALQLL